jgi:ketosteroid isomerase-like protein
MCRFRGEGSLMKKIVIFASVLLGLFVATAFAQGGAPKGSELLFKLEAEFAQDVAEHGHAAFASHFAGDGVELQNGGGITTHEEIANEPAWPEGTSLSWTPVKADMAASGDLGYTYGNFIFKSKDKDGKIVPRYGKYMSVWKRQKDGSWKVVVDMGNTSPEPK